MIYKIIITCLIGIWLSNDFKKDKGKHTKAKTLHAIIILLLFFMYSSVYKYLYWMIFYTNIEKEKYSMDVGIIPGQLHFVIHLCYIIFILFTLGLAFKLIKRQEKACQKFMYALSLLGITEFFNFYRGMIKDEVEFQFNYYFLLYIGFALFSLIVVGVILIYNSKYMKSFFSQTEQQKLIESIELNNNS